MMTCQELFDDAAKGKIGKGSECEAVLIVASSVCTCAYATPSPTELPSESPTTVEPTPSPTETPSENPTTMTPTHSPSMLPTNSPTAEQTGSPSAIPTTAPTISPTVTPKTCEAIEIANDTRDSAKMVNVTINFAFEDIISA